MTSLFALIGSYALLFMYVWLLSAIAASYLSERKGYGDRPGLATGMLLSALGLALVVFGVLRSGTWGLILPKSNAPEWLGLSPVIWLIFLGGCVLAGFLGWERRRLGLAGEAEAAGERVELDALGVPRVGRDRLFLGDRREAVAQLLQQAPARREGLVARLEGDRDGDLGARRQRLDQVELGRGEVVEPI